MFRSEYYEAMKLLAANKRLEHVISTNMLGLSKDSRPLQEGRNCN